jgi:hypothetical protein
MLPGPVCFLHKASKGFKGPCPHNQGQSHSPGVEYNSCQNNVLVVL